MFALVELGLKWKPFVWGSNPPNSRKRKAPFWPLTKRWPAMYPYCMSCRHPPIFCLISTIFSSLLLTYCSVRVVFSFPKVMFINAQLHYTKNLIFNKFKRNLTQMIKYNFYEKYCGPMFFTMCLHSMARLVFYLWKKLFFSQKDLDSPLIFVLFLKEKQNKKENSKRDSLFAKNSMWKIKVGSKS